MNDKRFRYTPHRAADAMKIIVGNKTNAVIRDFEETEEDIEELAGTIVEIDKDKMSGDGWKVKGDDGKTYQCDCAFNMYELPKTEEYGGIYYPTDKVTVKIKKNPVLGTTSITEITSLGKGESKIDLSKWKHGNKATTVIAKAKSAISVSDGLISFDYENGNQIKEDADGTTINGNNTTINTKNTKINSQTITINETPLEDYIDEINQKKMEQRFSPVITKTNEPGVEIQKQDNIGELTIDVKKEYISTVEAGVNANTERILTDLKNPSLYPNKKQRKALFSGDKIHELYLYPNGLVTVRSTDQSGINDDIFQSVNWITSEYVKKNVITVTVKAACECCDTTALGTQTYFNYCPRCHEWNVLYDKGNSIKCETCSLEWCQSCGHEKSQPCTSTGGDLKKYDTNWTVTGIGTGCDYCINDIPTGQIREYANYCPKCQAWGYLTLQSRGYEDTERRIFECGKCGEEFCVNCSISQGKSFIKNFLADNYFYEQHFGKNGTYSKLTYIRDD